MRVWDVGDEEPSDHPTVVDDDSVVWEWTEVSEEERYYIQLGVSINGNGGLGPRCLPWKDLLEEFGPLVEVDQSILT